ncbi:hypothetical protein WT55_21085 [Burkholderia pseudomultivorans]|nr:hypothetical protein WT55_21085 [Burkholderia pseudomultivorans]KWF64561.1 hypothetical protein WT57_20830 [Burkholderia pseudomultivorans]
MEYINMHRERMVLGAALLEDEDDVRVGMMIAVDLPDRQAVDAFMRDEPYNAAGIFESVVVRKCARIFPEEDRAHFDNLLREERRKAAQANHAPKVA